MRLSSTIAMIVASAAAIGLLAAATSSAPPKKPQFGFIDVSLTIQQYTKTKKVTDDLRKMSVAVREENRQKVLSLRVERNNLMQMDRSSLDYAKAAAELQLKKVKIEAENRARAREARERLREHLEQVYKEIVQVAESVARKEGMVAVFQVTDPDLVSDTADPMSVIALRSVIWSDKTLDITPKVLKELNR